MCYRFTLTVMLTVTPELTSGNSILKYVNKNQNFLIKLFLLIVYNQSLSLDILHATESAKQFILHVIKIEDVYRGNLINKIVVRGTKVL